MDPTSSHKLDTGLYRWFVSCFPPVFLCLFLVEPLNYRSKLKIYKIGNPIFVEIRMSRSA